MSSRIIVKHLPSKVTEKRLRELFSSCGEVTDVKLMKTRSGTFRHFGFVGFIDESQAATAVEQFSKTYVDASKIEVELAKPYGHEELARPWSKYSKGSSAHSRREKARAVESKDKEKKEDDIREGDKTLKQNQTQLARMLEEFEELESDPNFHEFLEVHQHKSKVKSWADSVSSNVEREKNNAKKQTKRSTDVDSGMESDAGGDGRDGDDVKKEDDESVGDESEPAAVCDNIATSTAASDMDYLRSKMVRVTEKDMVAKNNESAQELNDEEDDETESEDDTDGERSREEGMSLLKAQKEGGLGDSAPVLAQTPYTVKMLGLPFNVKKKNIQEFFHPLNLVSVRFTTDNQGRPSGRAYVDLESEQDLKEALKRNRDCIGHRYIELFRDDGTNVSGSGGKKSGQRRDGKGVGRDRPWEQKAAQLSEPESIAESGRLFVRNLSFLTTEEQLTELFGKFGPLTEATVPLDKVTGKPTGIAFVTFMLPEHAVKAYESLDGEIFLGRLLHILPAKARYAAGDCGDGEEKSGEKAGGSSYKKKKEQKTKEEAGKSHNWNTLFLGANAVADVIAERYAAEKSDIFDVESGNTTAAVRMALGETQLVTETREFMEAHGVNLEVFEKTKPKRSKNIILVKNLPFGTTDVELHSLFQPFGPMGRLILPPGGISALVEFTESLNARNAFKKLAYTNFKHLPLYLEWAPIGVLNEGQKQPPPTATPKRDAVQSGDNKGEEVGPSEQCTVFVKNLNFSTTEDAMKDLFSKVGRVKSASIARKRNVKEQSKPLSMGFGFVEFERAKNAQKAIKRLQHSVLDGHKLELKLSHRESYNVDEDKDEGKRIKSSEQKSAKILVRNIPFEASKHEVKELFQTFGELKTVRLPKKFSSSQGEHRGFGFVEFTTKDGAKRAFESLKHSTHLYGRRLVLEWAEQEESIESIRKRTAEHFSNLTAVQTKRPRKDQEQKLLDTLENTDL